jgi:hypothetical protein
MTSSQDPSAASAPMASFAEAARASGSDKFHHHGYHRFYPHHLDRFRDQVGNLVEIGVDEGRSLQLWRQYLPQAFLHGVDIGLELQGDRCIVHRCDQSDVEQLRAVAGRIGSAFAVIDDGSHIPEHQLQTFNLFFDAVLQPGGIYILEDIEVSYWRRGELYGYPTRYGLHDSRSLMAVMKLLVDWVNREFLSGADRASLQGRLQDHGLSEQTCDQVASIEFAHNCVILRKREGWELDFDGRPYPFASYVQT